MQLIMNEWFKAARKKLCSHSNYYTFIRNGKTFSGTRCHPYTGEASEKQKAQRELFSQARASMKTLTEEQLAAYKASYRKNPEKYATLNGYIFAKEMEARSTQGTH